MPKRAHSDDFESRTQSVGTGTSATSNSSSTGPRKHRRRGGKGRFQNLKSTGNSFSALSNVNEADESSNYEVVQNNPSNSQTLEQNSSNSMASPGFGRNRLASGFSRPQANGQRDKYTEERSNSAATNNVVTGRSSTSPIEISDDDMEESEGGMVINVDHDTSSALSMSSGEESGEILTSSKENTNPQTNDPDLFVVDPTPTLPVKRLLDLSANELDEQFKYSYFHLDRNQIDLNRPAVCLACSNEGHLHVDCSQKSTERFPPARIDPKTQVKLWISCCICASKSHLVGDCPKSSDIDCSRWSLKAFDPQQIVNLSLEKGMGQLEKDAENIGMRPPGLRIKGRAGMHRKGIPESEGSSGEVDEPFLRQPVRSRYGDIRAEPGQSDRYDRYNPPAGRPSYRGGGQWYSTDSFGRQRSRSPDDRYSYRPRDDYGRSDLPGQGDSWRPGPAVDRREPRRPRLQSPPRRNRPPTTRKKGASLNGPPPNIQFSLPTRKGSNSWSQNGHSGTSTPNSNGNAGNSNSKKNGPRHKKKGKKGS